MAKYFAVLLLFLGSQGFAQKITEHLTATIIGSGSPKYSTERSGPSVLISYKKTQILVDMGNGTQANLNKNNTKIKGIDGFLFTHHHLDHNEEFAPIFIQSLLGGNKSIVAGPKQTTGIVDHIFGIYEEDIEYRLSRSGRGLKDVKPNFDAKNLTGTASFFIGDVRVTYTPVHHTIATLAYRFDVGKESIVISGDLTYSESLPILAKDADYLIIDSGGAIELDSKRNAIPARNTGNRTPNKEKAHVNLAESALMAKEANVKNLVLTHFNFDQVDEAATTSALRAHYTGTVLYAHDLMTLPLQQEVHSHDGVSHAHHNEHLPEIKNSSKETLSLKNKVSITEDKQHDLRIIKSNAIPNHTVGLFPTKGNPNKIAEQQKVYTLDLTPELASNITYVYDLGIDRGKPSYVFGVAINGVKFEPSANEYFKNKETNQPNYEWPLEPLSDEVNLGEDYNNAHVQPNGEYHYHGTPTGLVATFDSNKMTLVGWAADGFPMYYKMGYQDPMNPASEVVQLKSSYVLKRGERPGDGISAPNGAYSGKYVRDYEYHIGSGDLDECNGRTGVTPEFPGGTYYYVVSDEFPSASRCFKGTPSDDFEIGGGRNRTGQNQPQKKNPQPAEGRTSNRAPSFTDLLKRMDFNQDKKISESEAQGNLKENFKNRDRNKDGYITEEEMTRNSRP
ncbi:ribonuclease BN (tRNA processing enzyme) [Dyadobacter jejuensis]|uniref:Ribonuclease BN (tRNA processing enzyme) n=1 Tax=Dyadobacter jejuensis TaxID=1082580 RepID=A0A316AJA4_9BACT|nr:YHYH protein [Dyadobacter jejuensis]PWJ57388.1 ribonuclease BN (tRNA processing enzyme) [Dyadobacter jejuensis]